METRLMGLEDLAEIFGKQKNEVRPERMNPAQAASFLRDCYKELAANQHSFAPGQLVKYTLGRASPHNDATGPMVFIGYLEDEGREPVYGYDFAHGPNDMGEVAAGMYFDCRVGRVSYSSIDGSAFFTPQLASSKELSLWDEEA